jgi:hydrogenase nickel incorporation protein HypA/HybF
MHEVDMTRALILTIKEWKDSHGEEVNIEKVHLIVGEFTCVEPSSLEFTFAAATQNTFLDGVSLVIKPIPLVAYCHPCQQEYHPEIGFQYACPRCHHPMDDIKSGRELKIDRIEYSLTSPTQ